MDPVPHKCYRTDFQTMKQDNKSRLFNSNHELDSQLQAHLFCISLAPGGVTLQSSGKLYLPQPELSQAAKLSLKSPNPLIPHPPFKYISRHPQYLPLQPRVYWEAPSAQPAIRSFHLKQVQVIENTIVFTTLWTGQFREDITNYVSFLHSFLQLPALPTLIYPIFLHLFGPERLM